MPIMNPSLGPAYNRQPVCRRPEETPSASSNPPATGTSPTSPQTPQDSYVPEPREAGEQGASSNFSQLLSGLQGGFPAPNEAEDRNGNSSSGNASFISGLSSPMSTNFTAGSPADNNVTQPIPIGGGYSATKIDGSGPAGPNDTAIIKLPGFG